MNNFRIKLLLRDQSFFLLYFYWGLVMLVEFGSSYKTRFRHLPLTKQSLDLTHYLNETRLFHKDETQKILKPSALWLLSSYWERFSISPGPPVIAGGMDCVPE